MDETVVSVYYRVGSSYFTHLHNFSKFHINVMGSI